MHGSFGDLAALVKEQHIVQPALVGSSEHPLVLCSASRLVKEEWIARPDAFVGHCDASGALVGLDRNAVDFDSTKAIDHRPDLILFASLQVRSVRIQLGLHTVQIQCKPEIPSALLQPFQVKG